MRRRTACSSSTVVALVFTSLAGLAGLAPASDALAAVGGPDGYGYTFVDQADGAVYAYIDITVTGTLVGTGDDSLFFETPLGAPFTFYGEVLGELRASTNGFLTSIAGTSSNLGNSCPLPLAQFGGGPRIAVLHNDLITTIYTQYFDEVAAAAVGYPGETEGITVYQWVGEHYPAGGTDAVDVEVVLFHDDDSILYMYAQDTPQAGDGATIAIQNAPATIALEYSCNISSLTPGVTAILFTPGEPPPPPDPDSDCCTASPTDTPGCTDPACEATVCAADAYCCDVAWDDVCADDALGLCAALCVLCGNGAVDPGEDCDTTGESATCDADCTTPACGDALVNAAAGEACDEGGESETCDVDCTAPECGDAVVNAAAGEACDDAGRSTTCNADCTSTSCGDGLVNAAAGETCDDAGESETCDVDCTEASCGDGTMNGNAGETCDDAGESARCDDDCTAVACGDDTTNAAAGEECDDGNVDAGDGCSPTCALEGEPGTTGDASTGDASEGSATGEPTGGSLDDTAGSSGPEPTTDPGPPPTSAADSSSGDETDTEAPGEVDSDDGCACTSAGSTPTHRGTTWSLLALLGLGALRRRRSGSRSSFERARRM